MMRMNEHIENIEPKLIIRYLRHSGWSVETLSNNIKRIFLQDLPQSDVVEIFFSGDPQSVQAKKKEVFFALNTISDVYEKTFESISNEVSALPYDVISSRIPDDYVLNDSIQLKVASQYINKMRDFLASAATTEIVKEKSFRRTRKEAIEYAEKCRFGHTFRGSFGFVVESPVGLNDEPTIDLITESPPLGRKVMERIARGLRSYSDAVTEQNPSLIANQVGGFSANMCDAMADIVDETEVSKLTMEMKLSPEWRVPDGLVQTMSFSIEQKSIEIFREAAKSMRVEEKPRPVTVFGRIKRLEADGNPADLLENPSSREIEVSWANEDNVLLQVKIMVPPQDYLDAVEAHKVGRPVSVSGMLTRSGRSWRLEEASSFKVISF